MECCFFLFIVIECVLPVVGVLPLPRTRQRCSAANLLHPSYIKDSATRLLNGNNSTELVAQLSGALSQTVTHCDLYVIILCKSQL